MEKVNESDWKVFRRIVPELRERYLAGVNVQLVEILQAEDRDETTRFWDAAERSDAEKKILRKCLDGHSRSSMRMFIRTMLLNELMVEADLEEFSDELREEVLRFREL